MTSVVLKNLDVDDILFLTLKKHFLYKDVTVRSKMERNFPTALKSILLLYVYSSQKLWPAGYKCITHGQEDSLRKY